MNIIVGNKTRRKVEFFIKRLIRNLGSKSKIKAFSTKNINDRIEAAYIINLDRQSDRWKQFEKEAKYQKVEGSRSLFEFCYRVSAIDGKILKLADFSTKVEKSYNLEDQYYVDPDPKLLSIIKEKNIKVDMTREEIAVALSHIKVWQRIVDERRSYALILEDDVFFEKTFAKQFNQAWEELPDKCDEGFKFDLLYLSFREVDRGAEKDSFSKNLNRPIRGFWWLSGYVLSYSGAKKLLNELPIKGPVDLWINHIFCKLDVYSTMNSIIYQRVDLKSDNNYSILPVLSQVGVQSDKTHLILEQKKGKNPVFVIGLDHTGSNIIDVALSLLGYRCCNGKWGTFSDNIEQLIDKNEPLLFDAYTGIKSITNNYEQLDRLYQDAVFILTTRDFDDWIKAHRKDSSINEKVESECLTQSTDIYKKHHNEILAHFKGKNGKLLSINIYDEDEWCSLCKFLACDIPNYPFPKNALFKDIPDLTMIPSSHIPMDFRNIKILEHDVHPWIIPFEKLSSFGILKEERKYGKRTGSFEDIVIDNFNSFDNSQWKILEGSFPSNLASFDKKNFSLLESQGFQMTLMKEKSGNRNYSSASIVSNHLFQFGRFEVEMKPAKIDGVITAFFLHRNDPWQEIDFEFLGRDTSKILANVYFNPGDDGSNCNFGNRGTPVIIDLNFDAAEDYHQYAIEWEPHELRWYVDNQLVHIRSSWEPSPVPDLPMQFFINTWPSRSEELAGQIEDGKLPINSLVKSVKISSWTTNSQESNFSFVDVYELETKVKAEI